MSHAFTLHWNFLCYNCTCKTETKQIQTGFPVTPKLSYTFHHRGTANGISLHSSTKCRSLFPVIILRKRVIKMSDSTYNKIKNIPLKLIRPNPCQPRKFFDPDSMDTLIRSVERYGILNPISVRQCSDNEYELISGERRFRAAYSAGLKEIPCIILDTDGSDCAVLSLLENLQREDLSFLEIAESYKDLIKKKGISSRDLSRKLGNKAYEINERINLMNLDPLVRKYIRSFKLTERQAKSLLKIKDKSRQIEATRQICENSLTEAETTKYINDLSRTETEPSVQINKIKDIGLLRNTISNAVSLIRNSGIDAHYNEKTHDWGDEFVIVVKNTTA